MSTVGLTLLVPDKPDPERDAVAAAWEQAGGAVIRLARFWDPPAIDRATVRLYGGESFCLVLEQKLALELCSPEDNLLLTLEPRFLGRHVVKTTVAAISAVSLPAFVKSLVPKVIRSRVYSSGSELEAECSGLDPSTGLLVSDVVAFVAEARCFVLDGRVLDCALYEGIADIAAARTFAEEVTAHADLPRTVVIDVGALRGGGWVVIELNATWGAGLNGCDPARVLPAIEAATRSGTAPG